MLINIDNGGTLTDVCVIDGETVHRTKVLTTPQDLSQCFFEGLAQVSRSVFGQEDLDTLLQRTEIIRYSTTQGTNALVQRRGPRLGLIVDGNLDQAVLAPDEHRQELFNSLIGDRIAHLTAAPDSENFSNAVVEAVNTLTSRGAARIVIASDRPDAAVMEGAIERTILRVFPRQMLGAVPVLATHRLTQDPSFSRRTWSALFNAFLHPAMERFLYHADARLRAARTQNPLLVFRNDGGAARVAKTVALKTYSSGPRGGMEGVQALAMRHGLARAVSFDVGGTTTDIGVVEKGRIRARRHGLVEGVAVSFPLADIASAGVGGSSIISPADGKELQVGPQSVGSAPGPACFGLGGREVTITDAALLKGLLDPATFLSGRLAIDTDRARAAVEQKVASPLGMSIEEAILAIEAAWVTKVAAAIASYSEIDDKTTLVAFGGAGPLLATAVADKLGANTVLLPALSPVFSAFGIGFSQVSQTYRAYLDANSIQTLPDILAQLKMQAARDMYGEGAELAQCELKAWIADAAAEEATIELDLDAPQLPAPLEERGVLIELLAIKPTPQIAWGELAEVTATQAVGSQSRSVLLAADERRSLPLYRLPEQSAGAIAVGPCVLEDPYATALVADGWRAKVLNGGDVLLERNNDGGVS